MVGDGQMASWRQPTCTTRSSRGVPSSYHHPFVRSVSSSFPTTAGNDGSIISFNPNEDLCLQSRFPLQSPPILMMSRIDDHDLDAVYASIAIAIAYSPFQFSIIMIR